MLVRQQWRLELVCHLTGSDTLVLDFINLHFFSPLANIFAMNGRYCTLQHVPGGDRVQYPDTVVPCRRGRRRFDPGLLSPLTLRCSQATSLASQNQYCTPTSLGQ